MSTPRFCWHCNGELSRNVKGGGYFSRTVIVHGEPRVVHVICAKSIKDNPESPHIFARAVNRQPDE